MSAERFRWLEEIGAEIIATPGCESNVKEIFDACNQLKKDPQAVVFNQFDELGNYLWHYGVTGPAVEEVYRSLQGRPRFAGWVSSTGSAGTIAAGDYLKRYIPEARITAAEALQCPTLLMNGFGAHRIEGIGDKHVPWIHNTRNTDLVAAIDDEAALRVFRLFNEPAGQELLMEHGIEGELVEKLPLLGISGCGNLLAAIKTARHFELDGGDALFTVFTDSAAMYRSRLAELTARLGPYDGTRALADFERYLLGATTDHVRELTYPDRKALHNLKYFTWVEQQGRTAEELAALWSPSFWIDLADQLPAWDDAITSFNEETGVLAALRTGTVNA
jgi:cysteine synthase